MEINHDTAPEPIDVAVVVDRKEKRDDDVLNVNISLIDKIDTNEVVEQSSIPLEDDIVDDESKKKQIKYVIIDDPVTMNINEVVVDKSVEKNMIRLIEAPVVKKYSSPPLEERAKVEGNYRGNGRISRVNGDGTVDIDNDDGEKEKSVEESMVRLIGAPAVKTDQSSTPLDEGAKVEGNYRGKGKWYPGRISRVNGDGTVDIDYDDGERETRVEESMVRLIGEASGKARSSERSSPSIEEGAKVEGNYRGKGKWYSARIRRVNRDGTVDIDYDDGEREKSVEESMVRLIGAPHVNTDAISLRIREALIDYLGPGARTTQKIKEVFFNMDRDNCGMIDKRDFEKVMSELRVEVNRVDTDRLYEQYDTKRTGVMDYMLFLSHLNFSGDSIIINNKIMKEGMKVEGKYRGKGRWCSGRISRVNRDGTVDIDYDDGDKDMRMEQSFVREVLAKSDERETPLTAKLKEGTRVEGNYRGKGLWHTGKISRVRLNGTFDVAYDDGESESGVNACDIRSLDAGESDEREAPMTVNLEEGARVEGNYRGKGIWYAGKVSRDRQDGTYDVAYDDGEVENRIESNYIRLLRVVPSPPMELSNQNNDNGSFKLINNSSNIDNNNNIDNNETSTTTAAIAAVTTTVIENNNSKSEIISIDNKNQVVAYNNTNTNKVNKTSEGLSSSSSSSPKSFVSGVRFLLGIKKTDIYQKHEWMENEAQRKLEWSDRNTQHQQLMMSEMQDWIEKKLQIEKKGWEIQQQLLMKRYEDEKIRGDKLYQEKMMLEEKLSKERLSHVSDKALLLEEYSKEKNTLIQSHIQQITEMNELHMKEKNELFAIKMNQEQLIAEEKLLNITEKSKLLEIYVKEKVDIMELNAKDKKIMLDNHLKERIVWQENKEKELERQRMLLLQNSK